MTDLKDPTREAARQALIARRLRARQAAPAARITPRAADAEVPLSYAQERVWFMDQLAPGEAAYHIAVPLRVRGPLDVDVLRAALAALSARHESLRTRFPADADGRPTVVVEETVDVPLTIVDAPDEAATQALVEAAAAEPFDLARGPLLRALLVRLAPADHVLFLGQHHIVGDGWSVDVLLRDLITLYRSGELPTLPVQYGDFAVWEAGELAGPQARAHVDHWRQRLAGITPLELPLDRPRPATQTYRGDFVEFTVERAVVDRLGELTRAAGGTLFMTLLAAYQVLLARHAGQDDFAVGASVAGRSAPELENVVGMFINMLPLRAELAGDPTFTELLARTKRSVLDGFEHGEVPFAKVVHELGLPRDVSRSPVFQAMFVLQNYEMGRFSEVSRSDEVSFEWTPMELRATRFDFELHAVEVPDGLWGKLVFNTDLFSRDTVERMARRWTTLLAAVVAAPDTPVSRLPLLPAEERALLAAWNDTAADFPRTQTLHGPIEERAASTPDAVALTIEGRSLTYAELNAAANRIAHRLRAAGVGAETLVGVCAERSVELVAGLLGVLKAGGAYLPLDPEYPADRLAFMVTDADAPVVLVQRHLRDVLPATAAQLLDLDDAGVWADQPSTDPQPAAGPEHLAYVIYTSGSTGRPKGVPNTHRGVVNRLDWMQRTYRLGADDAVLQKTPASFDVSVWEFFWPLRAGARLVLARPGGHKDAGYLRDLLVAERITTAHFVPSMLTVFLGEDGVEAATALRRVICSGEELPLTSAVDFTARLPWCGLHNLYGPTEAAIDVSAWPCEPALLARVTSVPIGAPITNLRLHVLDPAGAQCPVGVAGELHIGGVGLARGYHRRPALTAERFVPDPWSEEPGSRLYRTGDLARWVAGPDGSGVIEFLGRIDHQVKLRGLRIELGEIESTLREQPGVTEAAVIVREDSPGDKRLTAYLVGPAEQGTVKAALKETLPEYMVPAAFVTLDALPLAPNGKLDRRALPAPVVTREASVALVEPRDDTERALAAIWSEVLGVDTLGIDDDFFDLGGHSMLATQVVAKIRKAELGGRAVGVMDLFQQRTIRELAAFICGDAAAAGPRRLLYELTRPIPAAQRVLSYVCVPYGGGSAIVYQPLADALPAGHALWSLAIPGHDVGLAEDALPFEELTRRVADEILERVEGPIALYGHCGVGSAIVAEVARKVEAAGRDLAAVYIGAMFPFARPKGFFARARNRLEQLKSNRHYASWLKSMGVDTDELDPEQADRIISNMRADSRASEEYFTGLLDRRAAKLRAPIISVVGSEDPVTDYYRERYAEWQFLSDTLGLVVLDQAGHFFLKYRADELAEIVTRVHPAVTAGDATALGPQARGEDADWVVLDRLRVGAEQAGKAVVKPSMGRFLAVTAGQLVSSTGSALTAFALPIWLYNRTGSVADLGLLWALALICGVLMLPVAGAIVDRVSRRRIMMLASSVAGSIQLVLAALLWTDNLVLWHIYALVALSSVAGSFQRIAFQSAVPQLVPKRYLGHAMGVTQLTTGVATLLMPVFAAGLLAAIELKGILLVDVASYLVAVATLAVVRFPDLLGWRPRERLLVAIANGLRYSWRHRGFRLMLGYFALGNIFLAPALVLTTPLVLSFGTPTQVAQVAVAEAVGAVAGGMLMSLWGGPRRRRMIGVLIANLGTAIGCVLIGLDGSVAMICVGFCWLAMAMTTAQSIYATIVQVKVPQRYHGRVFSLNQTIAWSTLPIGFALLAPGATALFEPLLAPGGALAGSVGAVIGTGPGRGIGFAYVCFGLILVLITLGGFAVRLLRRFDLEVEDSLPDDLIGAQERERRLAARAAERAVPSVAA
ncbi:MULTISPECIES: non-ribosomal peptide synthetase/MFS transporter [Micromonospora]|uniref:Amino acid adenylation domain-containing protein n=1 Tax=Micromonospora solifontis TaxID=2487138 RepID=A0ABX9WH37_9ACTN|nr:MULTISPECIES: non-ribosomal peptide synthetase/MFS transporter [Micromonospora]NES15974.1 amino acid adenylation domain-containing protein [Micromonospora sp. PPF5-17B]NES36605.1 amino acid adenylation domain-containing protein [Micromonospora solifontis]NES57355.1 amino acid adenylation domain-containing protein [Micromonospora sp. PPF5-6]RNL99343.1 amino acid adenylation domain-containing protein [Micromonospora solifontis]